MIRFKKVLAGMLAVVMTVATTLTVFGATGITTKEQGLLDAMSSAADELGVKGTNQYSKYYSEVESYLSKYSVTDDQIAAGKAAVDTVKADIKAAMATYGVSNAFDLKNVLSQDKINALIQSTVNKIIPELKKVGIIVSADLSSAAPKVSVTDKDNNKIVSTTSTVKQTGFAMDSTIAVFAVLAGALAVCGVVARKKSLVEAR